MAHDVNSGEFYKAHEHEDICDLLDVMLEADTLIGHNIIGYDLPTLERLYKGYDFSEIPHFDTFVASQLAFPQIADSDYKRVAAGRLEGSLVGSYGLKAFGQRLQILKGDFHETTDWQEFTPEMLEYCTQDVIVNTELYHKIKRSTKWTYEALGLEQEVRRIIDRQTSYGWKFDTEAAYSLYEELTVKKLNIEQEIATLYGDFTDYETFTPKVNNKTRGYVKGEPFTKTIITPFNCGSRQHIARALKDRGWEPTVFTPTGIPQINETILEGLDFEGTDQLKEYFVLQKILGMVHDGKNGWLKMVKADGRIHGSVQPLGTVTGRMTHARPNIAQTPASYSPYGNECRSLFTVPHDKILVGCDAAGLELRCLGHFMADYDDGEYANIVVNGDIHTANMNALGITDRDVAKTFIYAFLYGAGGLKLADILGFTHTHSCTGNTLNGCTVCNGFARQGNAVKQRFLRGLPALGELLASVQEEAESGFVAGLDKRMIPIRSIHSSLNAKLQSAGALVMKQALLYAEQPVRYFGAEFVGNIHDEFQIEAPIDKGDAVGNACVEAIRGAGIHFKFKCPLDGEYQLGRTWKETH